MQFPKPVRFDTLHKDFGHLEAELQTLLSNLTFLMTQTFHELCAFETLLIVCSTNNLLVLTIAFRFGGSHQTGMCIHPKHIV